MPNSQASGHEATDKASLEAELRNMILSNVSIPLHQPQAQQPWRQQPAQAPPRNPQALNSPRRPYQQPPGQPNHQVSSEPRRGTSFPRGRAQRLWNPTNNRTYRQAPHNIQAPPYETFIAQCHFLGQLASLHIPNAQMTPDEMVSKDTFRSQLEAVCQAVLAEYDVTKTLKLELKAFGSFSSGFATRGSDMDLSISLTRTQTGNQVVAVEPALLRALEKALLDRGLGARLLTRTRVPIIKICQAPTPELFAALSEERQKWEALPEEKKYSISPPPSPPKKNSTPASVSNEDASATGNGQADTHGSPEEASDGTGTQKRQRNRKKPTADEKNPRKDPVRDDTLATAETADHQTNEPKKQQDKAPAAWTREKKMGPLDFPKSGVGIQSDINFSNDLALHNTHLLRCYCLCDPRVQDMVLFVKTWAKRRKINSSYSGTLSSYGYVLMVLHFLANVADPPVVPNLQLSWKGPTQGAPGQSLAGTHSVKGFDIRYWDDEAEIKRLAMEGRLTINREPLPALLRNFFHYYATTGVCFGVASARGFQWTQEILSLRTPGGIMRKEAKGWTGAKTTLVGQQEVRNRYLFAIEDPFEIDHNVARTVTHRGVVAIRDEFRRAWRIINSISSDVPIPKSGDDDLFAEVDEVSVAVVPTEKE